jgi:hypothetical protein
VGRRLTPDQHLEIALTTCAQKHARTNTPKAAALDELRLLAHGHSDLLAKACGQILGGFLALPGSHHPSDLQGAALLFEAGADPRLVTGHADESRRRAGGHHTTHDVGGPPNA